MVATEGARADLEAEVVGDGVWAAVMAGVGELLRRRTIALWISGAAAWAHDRGRRERGSSAS